MKFGLFLDFSRKSFWCVSVSFFFGCSQITRKFYNKKDRLFCLSFSYCAVPFEKIYWHSALGEKLLDCIASATGYDSNGFSARLRYCENVCHAITSLRVVEVLVNCAAMSGRAFFRPAVSTLEEVTVFFLFAIQLTNYRPIYTPTYNNLRVRYKVYLQYYLRKMDI